MRASASALKRLSALRAPAEQVGAMLVPFGTEAEWEAAAIKQQAELLAASARDRADADHGAAPANRGSKPTK